MYLEVVNPLFGLTKGSVPTAMIQAITDFYQWLEFLCPLSRCREETFSSGPWLAMRKECRLSLLSFIFSWPTQVLRCSGVHILLCGRRKQFDNLFSSKVPLLYSQHLRQKSSCVDMASVILAWEVKKFTEDPVLVPRYSLWIPLYPVGFICEGVIAYKSIVYLEETQRWQNGSNIISCWYQNLVRATILLPNSWNIAFHLPNIIRFYLLFGFFPMLYNQMCHMYNLRLEFK